MPFPVGSIVVLVTLGKKRGIVVEAGRGGRYRVQVENTVVSCRENDLMAPPERKRKGSARKDPEKGTSDGDGGTAVVSRIDLHGLTVEEAIARVLREINQALLRGANRIEIVHGKGSGRIRDALHRELTAISVVASFRLDPHNPGVTWIFL